MAVASPWNSRGLATPRERHLSPKLPQYPMPMNIPLLAPSHASHTRQMTGPAPYGYGRSGSNQECGDGQPPAVPSPGNAFWCPVSDLAVKSCVAPWQRGFLQGGK